MVIVGTTFLVPCQVKSLQHIVSTWGTPRLAPSQWETSLQSNAVSHWLDAKLDSALFYYIAVYQNGSLRNGCMVTCHNMRTGHFVFLCGSVSVNLPIFFRVSLTAVKELWWSLVIGYIKKSKQINNLMKQFKVKQNWWQLYSHQVHQWFP